MVPPESLLWAWHGFWTLHRCRPSFGFGPGAITMSDIAAYVSLHQVQEPALFADLVCHLDSLWLQGQAKREKDRPRDARDAEVHGRPPKVRR